MALTIDQLKEHKRFQNLLTLFKLKFLLNIDDGQEIDEKFIDSQFNWFIEQFTDLNNIPLGLMAFICAMGKIKISKGNEESISTVKEFIELVSSFNENISEFSEEISVNDEQLRSLYATQIRANFRAISPLLKKVFALPINSSHDVVGEIDCIIEELTLIKNQHKNKPESSGLCTRCGVHNAMPGNTLCNSCYQQPIQQLNQAIDKGTPIGPHDVPLNQPTA